MARLGRLFAALSLPLLLLVGMSASMAGCPPPPPAEQCTSVVQGSGSNLGAYHDPNISNSNGFNTYVSNNGWGATSTYRATICGPDYGAPDHFAGPSTPMHVTVKDGESGGTVESYPNIQQETNNFNTVDGDFDLDSSHQMTMSYNMTDPPLAGSGEWEAGSDLWNSGYFNEIMVWTQSSQALQNDAYGGSTQYIAHVTIAGVDYSYRNYGDGLPFLVKNDQASSGTIDYRAVLNWMKTKTIRGATPTATTNCSTTNKLNCAIVQPGTRFGQMDYGWEVRGLSGSTQTFKMNSYSLTLS